MTDPENHNDADILRIDGIILDTSAYDALAVVTNEDVEQIPRQWAKVVGAKYKNLLDATTYATN